MLVLGGCRCGTKEPACICRSTFAATWRGYSGQFWSSYHCDCHVLANGNAAANHAIMNELEKYALLTEFFTLSLGIFLFSANVTSRFMRTTITLLIVGINSIYLLYAAWRLKQATEDLQKRVSGVMGSVRRGSIISRIKKKFSSESRDNANAAPSLPPKETKKKRQIPANT